MDGLSVQKRLILDLITIFPNGGLKLWSNLLGITVGSLRFTLQDLVKLGYLKKDNDKNKVSYTISKDYKSIILSVMHQMANDKQ